MDNYYYNQYPFELLFTYGVVERIRRKLSLDVFTETISAPTDDLEMTLSALGAALQVVSQDLRFFTDFRSFRRLLSALRSVRIPAYDFEDMLDAAATEHLERKVTGVVVDHMLLLPPPHDFGLYSDLSNNLRDSLSEIRGLVDVYYSKMMITDLVASKPTGKSAIRFVQTPAFLLDTSKQTGKSAIRFVKKPLPDQEDKSVIIPPAFLLDVSKPTVASSDYDRLWPSEEDTIVGRISEKEQIISFIFRPPSNQVHPNFISVQGDSGIGKTTLLKLVCNDVSVSNNFGLVLWALDSRIQTYMDLKRVIIEIIRSATPHNWFYPQNLDIESLKGRLRGILQGQKYLLVLDDFELEEPMVWEELRELLVAGSTGSTAILVCTLMDRRPANRKIVSIKGLPENESWSLFTRCAAFDAEAEQRYPSLKQMGRCIVEKCDGNPLAVKILGSTLHNNRDERTWRQIMNSEKWRCYPKSDVANVAMLIGAGKMSYDLMQCFCGYAIFPDKVISRDQLVYLWMAQGLLQSSEEKQDLRDIGDTYCNELLFKNFLQSYHSDCPHHDTLQMHNHAHELAKSLMQRKKQYVPSEFPVDLIGRNLLWSGDQIPSDQEFPWHHLSQTKARSFLFKYYVGHVPKPFLEGLISALSYVRILFLDGSEFEELPETIGNLKLLRYLSLTGNHILQVLPGSICKLVNLQTLDLSGCEQLTTLPTLVRLWHLLLTVKLTSLPANTLERWMSLRLLKICNFQNLKSLPNKIAQLTALRVLRILDCPSIASLPNSIKCLSKLEELRILNCQILDLTEWNGLDGLKGLRFLQLQGIPKLSKFPEGLQSAGDSLRHLVVTNCESLLALPTCLQICNKLLELVIDSCPNMVTLPGGIQAVKTLQVLKISNCPKLVGRCEPGRGEDWHLISHIPKVQLDHQVIQNRDVPSALDVLQNSGGKMPNKPTISPLKMLFNQLKVRDRDRDTRSTPPPPPPPSFHQDCGPPSTWRILRNRGLDSQGSECNEERLDQHETDVEKEAEGNRDSEFEKPHDDQLQDSVVPSDEIASFSKGILFLLGESYEFAKEKLIQLWMAGGFIKEEPMEINGATYFEKLTLEGYILPSDSISLYKVNTEKVNSDLGMIQDNWKYLILESTSQHIVEPEEILHVSVVYDDINDAIFKILYKFNNLRTLLFLGTCGSGLERVLLDLFLSLESLAVLDLTGTAIKELPCSVGKMVHLRYLDLSWTLIELLPETMSRLQRLQTLKLKGCSCLHRLPRDMKMLTELRHLDFNILGQTTIMPNGMGALRNLRTLSTFVVGTQEGCKITELRDLNNLTGEFCIARLENVKSVEDAELASLTTKYHLKKLDLRWSDFSLREIKNEVVDYTVLKNLRPHSDLEELQIRCYGGTNLPSWIAHESFHELSSITLFKCERVSTLPSMQKLPSLEHLELISLNGVIEVDVRGEIGHVAFPKLRKLTIDEMVNLETWIEAEEGDFPCLVELTIKDCPKLSKLPSFLYLSSMKRLEISCCPQVQFFPDKKISSCLEFLIVEDCPLIKESCWEQGGTKWDIIEHVPNVWIDQEAIAEQTDYDSDLLGK